MCTCEPRRWTQGSVQPLIQPLSSMHTHQRRPAPICKPCCPISITVPTFLHHTFCFASFPTAERATRLLAALGAQPPPLPGATAAPAQQAVSTSADQALPACTSCSSDTPAGGPDGLLLGGSPTSLQCMGPVPHPGGRAALGHSSSRGGTAAASAGSVVPAVPPHLRPASVATPDVAAGAGTPTHNPRGGPSDSLQHPPCTVSMDTPPPHPAGSHVPGLEGWGHRA